MSRLDDAWDRIAPWIVALAVVVLLSVGGYALYHYGKSNGAAAAQKQAAERQASLIAGQHDEQAGERALAQVVDQMEAALSALCAANHAICPTFTGVPSAPPSPATGSPANRTTTTTTTTQPPKATTTTTTTVPRHPLPPVTTPTGTVPASVTNGTAAEAPQHKRHKHR